MRCRGCNQEKQDEEFCFRNQAQGIRHSRCKECVRQNSALHYAQNKDAYKKRGRANNDVRRRELLDKLYAYLTEHSCVDCGETDPLVLDFDHQDSTTKYMAVSDLRRRAHAWKRILEEIEKCEVRCANCHRRKTAQQFGWYVPEWYVFKQGFGYASR